MVTGEIGKLMIRFGLCCLFVNEPVRFRTTTASYLKKLSRKSRLGKLSSICLENSKNLQRALISAKRMGIGAFRISSDLFPVYTHPETGYHLDDFPDAEHIRKTLREAGTFAVENNIRLSFHPDQFIIISSPRNEVVANSVRDLIYHFMLADLTGAEIINIHLGGRYGSKVDSIERFRRNFEKLPSAVRARITLENDDISYTPSDLHGLCMELGIPLVYDVHHHRCNPDGLSIEAATSMCLDTWRKGKEPYFHISSPRDGWNSGNKKSHADYIDPGDFPTHWLKLRRNFTLDVEAKAKELAVQRLMKDLRV